jgi:hypothetical protein
MARENGGLMVRLSGSLFSDVHARDTASIVKRSVWRWQTLLSQRDSVAALEAKSAACHTTRYLKTIV